MVSDISEFSIIILSREFEFIESLPDSYERSYDSAERTSKI